jgi:hypothetical protein
MKTYMVVKVKLHVFLTSGDEVQRSAARSSPFAGCMGSRADLDAVAKKAILSLSGNQKRVPHSQSLY